jgi:hypothetical protein
LGGVTPMKDTCVLLLALTSACLPNFDAIAQPILQALHETGPVGRRINVVFVAEGYTAPELEKFTNDAQRMASALLHTTPYSEYASFFNIFSLWVASEESGSDFPQFGVFKDTEFDSRFNCKRRRPGRWGIWEDRDDFNRTVCC